MPPLNIYPLQTNGNIWIKLTLMIKEYDKEGGAMMIIGVKEDMPPEAREAYNKWLSLVKPVNENGDRIWV